MQTEILCHVIVPEELLSLQLNTVIVSLEKMLFVKSTTLNIKFSKILHRQFQHTHHGQN